MTHQEYLQIFLAESREHLLDMQRRLASMVDNPADREGLDALFRSVHSIKGMAASMGFRRLAAVAHAMEDGLDRLRRSGRLPPEAVDRLYQGVELLEQRLAGVEAGRPEEPEGEGGAPETGLAPGIRLRQLRLRMPGGTVSRWLLLVNELMRLGTLQRCHPAMEAIAEGTLPEVLEVDLLGRHDADEVQQRCRRICDGVLVETAPSGKEDRPSPLQHGVGQATVRVSTRLLDRFVGLSGELLTARYRLQESLHRGRQEGIEESCQQLDRLLSELRRQVLETRMVPLEAVTAPLPGLVRQLCRKNGKDVRLKLSGTEVRLDRAILEALAEPLAHMVRNAVDHGIEHSGTITITARRDRDRVTLDVCDDGRGLDPQLLVERARRDGFLPPGRDLGGSGAELLQLLCRPGFSTAGHVSETSGRGVGMDVVRHAVDRLGGRLEVTSRPGQGACFRFILPLTVAIVPVLLVEAAGQTVALPLMWIEQTIEVSRQQLRSWNDGGTAAFGTHRLPLYRLATLLNLPDAETGGTSAFVCELRGGRAGLAVDAVAGYREVFVHTLSFPLDQIHGLSGATILGDGRVIFLLDPCALLSGRQPTE